MFYVSVDVDYFVYLTCSQQGVGAAAANNSNIDPICRVWLSLSALVTVLK